MRIIPQARGGNIHAVGGELDNWGLPLTPYIPPLNWHTAAVMARREDWLSIVLACFDFSTLGVATGVMLFSADRLDVPPALAYCRTLSEVVGLSVGNSLFLRAALDDLHAGGLMADGVVVL
jgi:hypothetical protein